MAQHHGKLIYDCDPYHCENDSDDGGWGYIKPQTVLE
jgi:hypothetical protein